MSRVDELVAELAPDGVEFATLGELLAYEQPTKYLVASIEYSDSYTTPVLTAGQTFILGRTAETDGIYPASASMPTIIFDDFTTAFKWVDFPFKAKSSAMKMLTPKNPARASLRYLQYVMQTIRYEPQDHARQWIGTYSGFEVPVPPLEVQQEIVRVLDQFTELEAELETELEARRRQYEHYRDSLYGGIDRAGWVPLSQVGQFERGSALQKKDLVSAGIPAFHYGQVYTHYGISTRVTKSYVSADFALKKRLLYPGDLFIATTSENEEDLGKSVAWLGDVPAVASSDAYIFRSDADARFISHFFASALFHKQKMPFITGAKVKRLSGDALGKIWMPLPSLADQKQIADSLDKFEALVNDTSVGLPAELNARRSQYKYYRDKLLTFEEAAA